MITTKSDSGSSITVEGPRAMIDNLKKKLRRLLKADKEIGDNIFIELQSEFRSISTSYNTGKDKSAEEAPTFSEKSKNFLRALGHKEEEVKASLPKIPTGAMTLDEAKAKFGFVEKGANRFLISIPETQKATVQSVKNFYNSNPKEPRFSFIEDKFNDNSITYFFELLDDGNVLVRRSKLDTDEYHFVFTTLRALCLFALKNADPFINRFRSRAALYLKYGLSSIPEPFNPLRIPEFHCELIDKEYDIPPLKDFVKHSFSIPIFQALFLIEIFCEFQNKNHRCNFDKEFLNHKTIYLLSILAPLPVAFEYVSTDNTVTISFADCGIASASFVYNQLILALKIFPKLPLATFGFQNVDSVYLTPGNLFKISDDLEIAIMRGVDFNISGPCASFYIWAIPNSLDNSQVEQLEAKLKTMYNDVQLFMCAHCEKLFSIGYGGECSISAHIGNQIKFPDGQYEHVNQDIDGEYITVNYECCGEVEKYSPGCNLIVYNDHLKAVNKDGIPLSTSGFFKSVTNPA